MPGPTNSLLIEGTFDELADELAQYIDDVRKKQSDQGPSLKADVAPLLEQGQKDEALKKLVTASSILNSAPEKEFVATYNLLVHLVRQSPNNDKFLPKICQNLSAPITSSPTHGTGLALSILTTIFNILSPTNDVRYHVFLAILRVVRASSAFETLRHQLTNLDLWIAQWDIDAEDQRNLYLSIADAASDGGEADESYAYLLRALRTLPTDEVASPEAQTLSLRAVHAALAHPAHFDFQDLTALDSVQALRHSHPDSYELLELFNSELLEDYRDFRASHADFLASASLPPDVLERKIRLLTLASVAAATPSRSLDYAQIAAALQIDPAEVEMWVIDVIRAGLVEGKLSQRNQTFLIHRSTYRVFGERQWVEVQGRLDTWRASLEGVLGVIRAEREKMAREGVDGGGREEMGRGGRRREVDVLE